VSLPGDRFARAASGWGRMRSIRRDSLQKSSWLFVIFGLLLQVAAWFLSVASQWKRTLRLGIRFFAGGIIFLGIVLVARSQIPQTSTEDKDVVTAVTQLITDPMVTRFIAMIVLGVITGVVGFAMNRKTAPTVS